MTELILLMNLVAAVLNLGFAVVMYQKLKWRK